jgi:hypothetical protein
MDWDYEEAWFEYSSEELRKEARKIEDKYQKILAKQSGY